MSDHAYTTNRRTFLKTAAAGTAVLLAGLVGLPPARTAQAASPTTPGGAPANRTMPLTLENARSADFAAHLGERFILEAPSGARCAAELVEVFEWPMQRANGEQAFSLVLRQLQHTPLPQNVYPVTHETLGTLTLLLVPLNGDQTRHEALLA